MGRKDLLLTLNKEEGGMDWVENFQLFLFDFDGLLVNTEALHFQAYQRMCHKYDCQLEWTFVDYCRVAHHDRLQLEEEIYQVLPQLYAKEPNWSILYEEKKRAFVELVHQGRISLMPGIANLLKQLEKKKINRCVVTHSPRQFIDLICLQHPVLQTIPHWITREDYQKPKPASECYHVAINRLAKKDDAIIGFEDTLRGMTALLGTKAKPVLVSEIIQEDALKSLPSHVMHVRSFEDLFSRHRSFF